MKKINDHLSLATLVQISNIWVFRHEGKTFLIDSGYALERPALWWSVRSQGPFEAVILTHRHSDHAGNAAWLRDTFRCPVVASAEDAPFLEGKKKPPPLARGVAPLFQEFVSHFEDAFPSRTTVDETYSEGAWRWGFHAVPTPGHTEGSSMLYHEPTRTLFAGDSILVGYPPLRFWNSLRLSYPGYSLDVERNWRTVKAYLEKAPPIDVLCSGHGPALAENVSPLLKRLHAAAPGDRIPTS